MGKTAKKPEIVYSPVEGVDQTTLENIYDYIFRLTLDEERV